MHNLWARLLFEKIFWNSAKNLLSKITIHYRTREQRISDSGNSTTSSCAGYAENGLNKNNDSGRKRSTASSTTSTLSNQFSNGTIIDDIGDDDQYLEDLPSSASTGNAEIRAIRNEISISPKKKNSSVRHDLNYNKTELSYQDVESDQFGQSSDTVSAIDCLSS